VVALAILSYPELKKMTVITEYHDKIDVPYKAGFLGMRESDMIVRLVKTYQARDPPPPPIDLLFCNGNGQLHERKFGAACQIGLALNLPCIGMARTIHFAALDPATTIEPLQYGQHQLLYHSEANHEVVGAALMTYKPDDRTKPMIVSVGHRISLNTAITMTLACCKSRLRMPEPIHVADGCAYYTAYTTSQYV
jgi:deoxyinosine 3'endonuclease (endonuclease V)